MVSTKVVYADNWNTSCVVGSGLHNPVADRSAGLTEFRQWLCLCLKHGRLSEPERKELRPQADGWLQTVFATLPLNQKSVLQTLSRRPLHLRCLHNAPVSVRSLHWRFSLA